MGMDENQKMNTKKIRRVLAELDYCRPKRFLGP